MLLVLIGFVLGILFLIYLLVVLVLFYWWNKFFLQFLYQHNKVSYLHANMRKCSNTSASKLSSQYYLYKKRCQNAPFPLLWMRTH